MTNEQFKDFLREDFRNIYGKKCRLLAVQLNGFSHKVFYDYGRKKSNIIVEEYSGYTICEKQTENVKRFLSNIPHYMYNHNALELVFVAPEKR